MLTYKPTVLNVSAGLSLVSILVYTFMNYNRLALGEGWGIVAMFGISFVVLGTLLVDLILQQFIQNKIWLNIIGFITAVGLAISILADL
jgi:hypothetical protein